MIDMSQPATKAAFNLATLMDFLGDDKEMMASYLESVKRIQDKVAKEELLYCPSDELASSVVQKLYSNFEPSYPMIHISDEDARAVREGEHYSLCDLIQSKKRPVTIDEIKDHPALKGKTVREMKSYLINECNLQFVNNWWTESMNGRSEHLKGYIHRSTEVPAKKPQKVYVLKLVDGDGTVFYKVGVSSYPLNRLSQFTSKGVEGEVIQTVDHPTPFKAEKLIKETLKEFKYEPIVKGLPESECFCVSGAEVIRITDEIFNI